jgi:hypothetical protein
MAKNNKIATSELDFDSIKQNLKEFLQGQSTFSDYNFEGSGLSILLDILAVNTHYNALYTNLAVNESYLDSASKRNSVVSLAKTLGYTPRSSTCAKARLNLQIIAPTSTPDFVTLPKYSPFSTSIDGEAYTFYTTKEYTAKKSADPLQNYLFTDVEVVEGTPLTFRYTVQDGLRYIIPNVDVDTSTLLVKIQDNASSSVYTTYNLSASIADVDPNAKVYFLKEIDDGLYELVFGNGSIGQALQSGNVVHMEYFVTNKDVVNGASSFTYTGSTLIGGALAVTVLSAAAGGSEQESIESIKFNAPKFYAARNRAVTAEDYQVLILNNLPEAEFVSVWGGEDNIPPVYGKVFICVKPRNVSKLTETQKSFVVNSVLSTKNMVSISPVMVDPEYIEIGLDVTVYYNASATTKDFNDIEGLVKAAITSYDTENLQKFNGILRHSKLTAAIDASDSSVVNNITNVTIRRSVLPKYNLSTQYLLNLINPIEQTGLPGAVKSSYFYIVGDTQQYYLMDDGNGKIQLVFDNATEKGVVRKNDTGSVDYEKGIIDVRSLNIESATSNLLTFTIEPASLDVVSALTQIARVDFANLNISVVADKTATGDVRGGYNYTFAKNN